MGKLEEHTKQVVQLLQQKGIPYEGLDESTGLLAIRGYRCKVASPRQTHFKISVNLEWFKDPSNDGRPTFPKYKAAIDFYLFAVRDNLIAIHYLDVRKYAFELERNIDYWQKKDHQWGMHVAEEDGRFCFYWNQNTRRFPAELISSPLDFIRIATVGSAAPKYKSALNEQPLTRDGTPIQPDHSLRIRVEQAATLTTRAHYERLGYSVCSVEKDNAGWDLEARKDQSLLRLEVKGLSQDAVTVELTPNEYAKMQNHKDSYRICVVTNALSANPRLAVFSYSVGNDKWQDEGGLRLSIAELVAARLTTEQQAT